MTTTAAADGVVLGEIHTGLLRNSRAVSAATIHEILTLTYGKRVTVSERPVPYAVSPELLTGVDCAMPATAGARVRGVGTVASRVLITGGHVVQGSAFARTSISAARRRMPWAHYLSRPGVLELIGGRAGTHRGIAASHLTGTWAADVLDLGAVAGRALESVQRHDRLDRRVPFQAARSALRWAMGPADGGPTEFTFSLAGGATRTAYLPRLDVDVRAIAALLEDIALHDWLLTTLLALINRSQIGSAPSQEVVERLRPAVDFLLHLWMPAARIDNQLTALWEGIERRPGLSRQWWVNVSRIRDQVALAALGAGGRATT